jgi:hypothetical protein
VNISRVSVHPIVLLTRLVIVYTLISASMTRKFETYTFSNSKFFTDRGSTAEAITERINVCTVFFIMDSSYVRILVTLTAYCIILCTEGRRRAPLWGIFLQLLHHNYPMLSPGFRNDIP